MSVAFIKSNLPLPLPCLLYLQVAFPFGCYQPRLSVFVVVVVHSYTVRPVLYFIIYSLLNFYGVFVCINYFYA